MYPIRLFLTTLSLAGLENWLRLIEATYDNSENQRAGRS